MNLDVDVALQRVLGISVRSECVGIGQGAEDRPSSNRTVKSITTRILKDLYSHWIFGDGQPSLILSTASLRRQEGSLYGGTYGVRELAPALHLGSLLPFLDSHLFARQQAGATLKREQAPTLQKIPS